MSKTWADDAIADRAKYGENLRDTIDTLRAMLRRLEWAGRDEFYPHVRTCPECGGFQYKPTNPHLVDSNVLKSTHKPDCDLATLLRDLP